jgi:hypothetical protein
MSGLFRRNRPPADAADPAGAEQPTTVLPAAGAEQPTEAVPPVEAPEGTVVQGPGVVEHAAAGEPAPEAGSEPAAAEPVPEGKLSFRDRGRLRRRLRFLRRVRELGFRDLGGLVFDQHRFGRPNPALVEGKLAALLAVDGELRAIEVALQEARPITELREPGITACARCGAVHGSEARFCPSCGIGLRGPRAVAEVGDAVSPLGVPAPPPAAPPPADAPAWATPADPGRS